MEAAQRIAQTQQIMGGGHALADAAGQTLQVGYWSQRLAQLSPHHRRRMELSNGIEPPIERILSKGLANQAA
jgi:hypothetical protein